MEAAKHAVESVIKQEADERFVIVLSDANLDRYGIPPKKLAEILTTSDDVNAYVIFIGSLGDQAQRYISIVHRINNLFIAVTDLLFVCNHLSSIT